MGLKVLLKNYMEHVNSGLLSDSHVILATCQRRWSCHMSKLHSEAGLWSSLFKKIRIIFLNIWWIFMKNKLIKYIFLRASFHYSHKILWMKEVIYHNVFIIFFPSAMYSLKYLCTFRHLFQLSKRTGSVRAMLC